MAHLQVKQIEMTEQLSQWQYEDEILQLIDGQLRNDENSLTQSDLQGAVSALVFKIRNNK